MNLIRTNPNSWVDFPFDRIFDDFLPRRSHGAVTEGAFAPRVDIREEKDAVIVTAELPGVSQDDLSVELENGILTVSGEKKTERSDENNGFTRSERAYGSFRRSFKVADSVDAESISADYTNGVLRVSLPKKPEAAPRQITIQGENGAAKKIEAK